MPLPRVAPDIDQILLSLYPDLEESLKLWILPTYMCLQ